MAKATKQDIRTVDLCAAYMTAARSYNDFAHRLDVLVETAKAKAPMPKEMVEAIKMPEFRDLASLGHVYSHHVSAAVKYIEESQTRKTGDDKNFVIEFRQGGFPLTANQRMRLAKLKALLKISRKYDADLDRALKKARHSVLCAELDEMGEAMYALLCRVVKARAVTRDDLKAKIKVYKADRGEDLARSIIEDAAALV